MYFLTHGDTGGAEKDKHHRLVRLRVFLLSLSGWHVATVSSGLEPLFGPIHLSPFVHTLSFFVHTIERHWAAG